MIKGKLYLVATPIGNLEDISFRALRILNEVSLIACEDTRRTKQLCNYYKIKTPLVSYHEHNEHDRISLLLDRLNKGQNIAVVSDAGTPAISDPGSVIVKAALAECVSVIPIPGPSAFLAALIASGLDTNRFIFIGFLPRKSRERKDLLKKWIFYQETLVFYVSPHRYLEVIKDLCECLGEDRDAVVARELTKLHETFIRGKLGCDLITGYKPKGEICLILSGSTQEYKPNSANPLNSLGIDQHLEFYLSNGVERRNAIKSVAKDRGLTRNEAYDRLFKK